MKIFFINKIILIYNIIVILISFRLFHVILLQMITIKRIGRFTMYLIYKRCYNVTLDYYSAMTYSYTDILFSFKITPNQVFKKEYRKLMQSIIFAEKQLSKNKITKEEFYIKLDHFLKDYIKEYLIPRS